MSEKEKETIADIVAEMRTRWAETYHSERHKTLTGEDPENEFVSIDTEDLADRIEAAAKRHCSGCTWYHIYNDGLDELRDEALAARCANCRFFQREHSHCTLNDSLTNAKYKCSGWKFKKNKECADNHEVAELRAENARLRAALKPVLDVHNFTPAEFMNPQEAMAAVHEAQRIYNESEESK